jgi:sec-independent protein translocase protein TatA
MRIGPFGIWEIVIIVVVVLLIFGANRLPQLARSTARTVRDVRKEIRDLKADLDVTEPAPAARPKAEADRG